MSGYNNEIVVLISFWEILTCVLKIYVKNIKVVIFFL
jgi:hypothetical protein